MPRRPLVQHLDRPPLGREQRHDPVALLGDARRRTPRTERRRRSATDPAGNGHDRGRLELRLSNLSDQRAHARRVAIRHDQAWPCPRAADADETSPWRSVPSVPSEPTISFGRSKPATFLTTLPPPRASVPSARTSEMPMMRSRTDPYRARRGPKAFAATMPPTVARSGRGGSSASRWPAARASAEAPRESRPLRRRRSDRTARARSTRARRPVRTHDVEAIGRSAELEIRSAADDGQALSVPAPSPARPRRLLRRVAGLEDDRRPDAENRVFRRRRRGRPAPSPRSA